VKFAVKWGLLTFVANFIPYFGSIVACLLPILFGRVRALGGADRRLGLGARSAVILGSRERHDAVGGGPDDRLIEEAVGTVVSQDERLDPLA